MVVGLQLSIRIKLITLDGGVGEDGDGIQKIYLTTSEVFEWPLFYLRYVLFFAHL